MGCKILYTHYYHIEITGQTYKISESDKKDASALDTLKKIQTILTQKLRPEDSFTSSVPGWTPQGEANYLNSIAAVILDQYTSTVHKRLWYVPSFMSVLFDKVISPLRNLRESIRIEATVVNSARKLGYRGDDAHKAQRYIQKLYKEIDEVFSTKLIPNKYRARKWQHWKGFVTDYEKTVQNLKKIDTNDLFFYLSFNGLCLFREKVANLFSVKGFCIPTPSLVADSSMGSRALIKTIESSNDNNTELAELLLDAGADPKLCNDSIGDNALHCAARKGNSILVKRLLPMMSGDVNKPNWNRAAPLYLAWNSVWGRNREVLTQLLMYGAGTEKEREIVNNFLADNSL